MTKKISENPEAEKKEIEEAEYHQTHKYCFSPRTVRFRIVD